MKKTGENSVQNRIRKLYPGLDQEDLSDFHRLTMKYKHRARARGFDYTNLTDEEWEIVTDDNLQKLEKGERIRPSWTETVGKGLIEDAREYLERKPNSHVIDNDDTITNWLVIPSSVKLAARGMKQHNDFMLQVSLLPPELIEKVKAQLEEYNSKVVVT